MERWLHHTAFPAQIQSARVWITKNKQNQQHASPVSVALLLNR
jgi:hypothetical protein